MVMLDAQFARARFIEDGDPQERCRLLAAALTPRLREASNSHQALEWILADLRELGHEVAQWDEIISDAWSSPQNDRYLWIVLDAPEGDDEIDWGHADEVEWASAFVSFRPRLRDLPRRCPQCFAELGPCDLRLRIQGHGSATAPALRVRFEAPGMTSVDAMVGSESLEVGRGGFSCESCGAAWFLPPS
jgi:hypothetical protein